jgi:hypothetical protein
MEAAYRQRVRRKLRSHMVNQERSRIELLSTRLLGRSYSIYCAGCDSISAGSIDPARRREWACHRRGGAYISNVP